ncbi:MAG: catalase family peroxidase [Variovorax sp.]|nr:catalase family peroxidase [Variovorax sp.]
MGITGDYFDTLQLHAARLSMVAAVTIAGVMAATWTPQAGAAPDSVQPNQSPKDLVDALHAAFGEHHARAVHAKGVILEGTFMADPGAKALSKAPIFASGRLPVTVRFSNFTGIPDIPDNIPEANPRGFAVKIKSSDGEAFDVVTHSFNGFPTSNSDEFAALLRSVGASGPDAEHPTPVERFLSTHPIAKTFLTTQKPPPMSYATAAYFGVNSLKFTNNGGKAIYVRYRFVPHAGEHYLSPEEAKANGPEYLQKELPQRIAKGPLVFDWYAQIAAPGDKIDDPSIAWPERRRLAKLGTLTITTVADDAETKDKHTLFLPGTPHSGIEAADPMLTLRTTAYPISFGARQ